MKRLCLLVVFLGLGFMANLEAQARLVDPHNPNAVPGTGQGEIVINAENSDRDIAVWMNGTLVAHVPPKLREKIIVQNGVYSVELADTTFKSGKWNFGSKKQMNVTANSNSTVIGMTTRYGTVVSMNIQSATAIGGGAMAAVPAPALAPAPQPARQQPAQSPPPASNPFSGLADLFTPNKPARPTNSGGTPIETAVLRAAGILAEKIPNGSTLAVLSIASRDPELAEFIIEELAYLMVETNKFKVVDRKSLDAVRAEANFQISGDVDDHSAVAIGKLLGASIVITGGVSGSDSTRRLRAKALYVQTAEIIAMASERY
jgi:TolB-like protein